jgi:hypothetical protein
MTHPDKSYPVGWATLGQEYDPTQHLMQIERFDKRLNKKVSTDYLNVQNRLIWFIRDQRALIAAGMAQTSYTIQTELVEHDREAGWAHFKTSVRDVLGNEATMYGSESVRDFPDYIEKASTKSLGRALLLLGYGTAFTSEIDEGDRVVDAPVPSPPAAPTSAVTERASANADMLTIETWCREHGVSGKALADYCNRFGKLNPRNPKDLKKLVEVIANPTSAAGLLMIQLALTHHTTLDVLSELMHEHGLATYADFWRSYSERPEEWDVFLKDFLKVKASA